MSDIRSYMKYKEQREKKTEKSEKKFEGVNYQEKIRHYRRRNFTIVLSLFLVAAIIGSVFYIQMTNRIYTDYEVRSSVSREMISGTTMINLEGTILTYSKDGMNCSDTRGNVLWNQTFEMQRPILATKGKTAAIADYNGRNIYVMNNESVLGQINTNLPIRDIAVSGNGVVTAVMDDATVTWIYLYDSVGNELGFFKTTMKNSGYPIEVTMSENGQLVLVSYLYVDSGEIKSKVAFYNFGQVGQNETDNFVSGYDYADAIVPYAGFMNASTAFAVADDRIMFFSGSQIPTNTSTSLFEEEVQGVYYDSSYVGLVYPNTESDAQYRIDVYNTSGTKVLSEPFDTDYQDIVFCGGYFVIYNEQECVIYNMNGVEKFKGDFKDTVYTMIPGKNVARYTLVTQDSIESIELK